MAYLTYEEYTSIGGILDLTAFERNIVRAFSIVDNATFNRLKKMVEISANVKALCRDLVEYYVTNCNVNEKSVASWSESQGPISESVSYVTKSKEEMQTDIDGLIYDYLANETDDKGTPLLYRGVGY